jgi:hypothetical protein
MAWDVVEKFGCDPTGDTDNAPMLAHLQQDLQAYVSAKRPLPKVIFPEGVYAFSVWPNLAINNLQMAGNGEVYLCHTGTGPAMVFDGDALAGGKFNLMVEDLRLIPSINGGTDGLVLDAIEHSYFKMKVFGAGQAGAKACVMRWCCLTELYNYGVSRHHARCSPFGEDNVGVWDCYALWLDISAGNGLQTTACRLTNPTIGFCRTGIHFQDAGGCQITGGAIEECSHAGIEIVTGGSNQSWSLWLELNSNQDIIMGRDTHDNRFVVTNPNANVYDIGRDNAVTSPSDLN